MKPNVKFSLIPYTKKTFGVRMMFKTKIKTVNINLPSMGGGGKDIYRNQNLKRQQMN